MQRDWKKYSQTPVNARLKYAAIGLIGMAALAMVVLFIVIASTNHELSPAIEISFRIFAGLCAASGAILLMILSYRIYSVSISERWTDSN